MHPHPLYPIVIILYYHGPLFKMKKVFIGTIITYHDVYIIFTKLHTIWIHSFLHKCHFLCQDTILGTLLHLVLYLEVSWSFLVFMVLRVLGIR